jgi:hypothetical protein
MQVKPTGPFTQIINQLDDALEHLNVIESSLNSTLNRLRLPPPSSEVAGDALEEENTIPGAIDRKARLIRTSSARIVDLCRELDDTFR